MFGAGRGSAIRPELSEAVAPNMHLDRYMNKMQICIIIGIQTSSGHRNIKRRTNFFEKKVATVCKRHNVRFQAAVCVCVCVCVPICSALLEGQGSGKGGIFTNTVHQEDTSGLKHSGVE